MFSELLKPRAAVWAEGRYKVTRRRRPRGYSRRRLSGGGVLRECLSVCLYALGLWLWCGVLGRTTCTASFLFARQPAARRRCPWSFAERSQPPPWPQASRVTVLVRRWRKRRFSSLPCLSVVCSVEWKFFKILNVTTQLSAKPPSRARQTPGTGPCQPPLGSACACPGRDGCQRLAKDGPGGELPRSPGHLSQLCFRLVGKAQAEGPGCCLHPPAREAPVLRYGLGTAGLPARCSCRAAPGALANAPGRALPPTGVGEGSHADAVNNVQAGPGTHGLLAKDKGALSSARVTDAGASPLEGAPWWGSHLLRQLQPQGTLSAVPTTGTGLEKLFCISGSPSCLAFSRLSFPTWFPRPCLGNGPWVASCGLVSASGN